ncbi:MAG: protein kinase [Deltaproteobacteria bacterium]
MSVAFASSHPLSVVSVMGRKPGEILGGRYRLIRPLGQGGMGSVWYAEHLSLNASVALKLIDAPTASDLIATERFLREARLAAALRSPHVVQILDYGLDAGAPYIVMELLEGESLAGRLERLGRLSGGETARMIQHVGRAMTRAHEAGIIHRDLKPENVFIVRNDDEEIYKVFDFGIAKVEAPLLAAGATRTGSLLGTPSYMSPEQAEGVRNIDHRADIWALGVITYRCLLGRLPFAATTLPQLILAICARAMPVPSHHGPVPEGFDAWFARACARAPADRFDSARQASIELSAILGDAVSLPEEAPSSPLPAPAGLSPTTSHFANSEVIARRARSNKRLALPILIAIALPLAAFVVSRITASLEQRALGTSTAAAPVAGRELEQVTQALEPLPEGGPEPRTEPRTDTTVSYPDLPSGVRLTAGVRVVPSLPRERKPAAPTPASSSAGPSRTSPPILPSIHPLDASGLPAVDGSGLAEREPAASPAGKRSKRSAHRH